MDFNFNEDDLNFRDTVSRFLMTEAAPEVLRDIWNTGPGRSPVMYSKIASQGITALSVPEDAGGLGMDDLTWSLMSQELGYYAIPDSVCDAAYVAASLIASLPDSVTSRDDWLAQIAEGAIRVAIGHPVNLHVADADPADWLLLAHDDEIHCVAREAIEVSAKSSIDNSRRLADVRWIPTEDTCVAKGELAERLWAEALNRGTLSISGQLLGLAQRILDLSIDYAAQRKQFGKPIGSFQAIKHHLADVATQIEFARPVLYRAAYALTQGESNITMLASHAKLAAGQAAWLAARHGIQVHGAMGYTWEVDLQMFMKRVWVLDASWGDRGFHKSRVADMLFSQDAQIGPGCTFED